MAVYSDYQQQAYSEKIGLVKLEASQRLMGWTVHSGSIYKISNFNQTSILGVTDSGTSYTEVGSIGAIVTGSFYHDRENERLYLRTSDSVNPNSKFIVCTFELFFSNLPAIAAHDLSTGFEVEWLPLLKETSQFGVEIDNQRSQLGIAIEGEGSITFHNDKSYWSDKFDKYTFENNKAYVYSWNRELPITEAKLIYRGRIQEKSWSQETVRFRLKDYLNELRSKLELDNLGTIVGAKIPPSFGNALKRQIYGYVNGFRPQNIDQVLDGGYDITGTISGYVDAKTLTGSGTLFSTQLRPGDSIYIDGIDELLPITTIDSDTQLVLTSELSQSRLNLLGSNTIKVKPSLSKNYTNRLWQISNHALREPVATISGVAAPNLFNVDTVEDFEVGDEVFVGSELATVVNIISGPKIRLSALSFIPSVGDTITRITVTNVKINETTLTYGRDYTYNATSGQLTLEESAEFNVADIKELSGTLDYQTSDTVFGTGTQFTTELDVNSWIPDPNGSFDNPTFVEILEIKSDTELRLKTNPGLGGVLSQSNVKYKKPVIFTEGVDTITCSTLGATEDGTPSGVFIKNAPRVVKDILSKAGLSSFINASSFSDSEELVPYKIGLTIPDSYTGRTTKSYRDIINLVNRSVFGLLIQNADFELEYSVLRPTRFSGIKQFIRSDIIDFNVLSDSSQIVKTVNLNYDNHEYDPATQMDAQSVVTSTSDIAQYLAKSDKTFDVDSVLVNQQEAQIIANRWSFLLELSKSVIDFISKLQGSRAKINDILDFQHDFLFERIGSSSKRKIGLVQSIKKSVAGSAIEIDDLSNSLSRCAVITEDDAPNYEGSSADDLVVNGYITDTYGMQDNDPETFGINVLW